MATLKAAAAKLLSSADPFSLEDLPKSREDPLWNDIKNQYGLKLQELSALKNAACEGNLHLLELDLEPEHSAQPSQPVLPISQVTSAVPTPVTEHRLIYAEQSVSHALNTITSNSLVTAEEKRYKCNRCGKGFKSRGGLKYHDEKDVCSDDLERLLDSATGPGVPSFPNDPSTAKLTIASVFDFASNQGQHSNAMQSIYPLKPKVERRELKIVPPKKLKSPKIDFSSPGVEYPHNLIFQEFLRAPDMDNMTFKAPSLEVENFTSLQEARKWCTEFPGCSLATSLSPDLFVISGGEGLTAFCCSFKIQESGKRTHIRVKKDKDYYWNREKELRGAIDEEISQDELNQPSKKRPRRSKKEPTIARKLSGYLLFCTTSRAELIASGAHTEISFGDTSRLIGARWKALTEAEKAVWNERAATMPPLQVMPREYTSVTGTKDDNNHEQLHLEEFTA